jgi:phage terminase large subunit-like protein
MFDQAKADRAVRIIECLKLTGDFHGRPFVFQSWNKKIVMDVFGTLNAFGLRQYKDVYVEIPKKNTKSNLGADICIKQLYDKDEPNGLIFFASGDKEQARLDLFDPLVEIITQDSALEKRVKITDSLKEIYNKETGTLLKVLSSDVKTKHGPNPSLVVMDELHAWHGRDLYDVLTHGSGLSRRQPLRIVLTTAGDDPDRVTIGWELHEQAKAVIAARKPGGDKAKDIPTMYPVIFAYEGEDIYNEKHWYEANPMLDIVFPIDAMRELATEAKLNPSKERLFRWLNLNQWITYKLTNWLPLDLWDATVGDWTRADLLGKDCFIGGDFSTTTDLSAICLVFPPQAGLDDWRVLWDCWIPGKHMQDRIEMDHVPYDEWASSAWINVTDGDMIDYIAIRERIQECRKLYHVIEMDVDRSFATMLIQELEQDHLTCVDIPQQYATLTDPMNQLEILLRQKRHVAPFGDDVAAIELPALTHEPHPVARWCFGNTSIARNGNAQIKYIKEHKGKSLLHTKRIDLTAAWVCAMARAKDYKKIKSVYETRGVRTVG